jgi:hypothetical protein
LDWILPTSCCSCFLSLVVPAKEKEKGLQLLSFARRSGKRKGKKGFSLSHASLSGVGLYLQQCLGTLEAATVLGHPPLERPSSSSSAQEIDFEVGIELG